MFTLAQLATKISATYQGEDRPFQGISIDSRTLRPGECFAAIIGPQFDGHQFIDAAILAGAGSLLVNRPIPHASLPQIIVADTTKALGEIASAWRKQFKIPVLGLTGSCGKTGTKEMLASILSQIGPTLATLGNKNNQYGVPLTLARLRPNHQFAVIEMGTNMPGEIAHIAKMAKPSVALITNINAAHVGNFASFEHLAQEKAEIYASLGPSGIAIINADEAFSGIFMKHLDERHKVSFGIVHEADVMAHEIRYSTEGVAFILASPLGRIEVNIPLVGEHVVYNALAAAATAMAVGAQLAQVQAGLAQVKPIAGRFKPHRLASGALLIDDTYNASVRSVENACKTLSRFKGKRIFVMSNMRELGEYSAQYHGDLGRWACEYKIDHLLLFGDYDCLKATLDNCDERAEYFHSKSDLIAAIKNYITNDATLVIKGSRSNKMEEVVESLLKEA